MRGKWLIACGLLASAMTLGALVVWADRAALKAELTSFIGTVEWRRGPSGDWKIVAPNQKLEGGDQIRTGDPGEATLTLEDGSTIQIFPGSEFSIAILNKDSATAQLESVLALLKGRVRAQVSPLIEGSTFEIETPVMVAAVRGTIFTVGVNPDGSIGVTSDDGLVDLNREGENKFTVHTDSGDEVLVEYDPTTGDIKITCIRGTFEVIGPDGIARILNEGDSIVFRGGAATFIPATSPVGATGTETFTEPSDDDSDSSAAAGALVTPASGG